MDGRTVEFYGKGVVSELTTCCFFAAEDLGAIDFLEDEDIFTTLKVRLKD